MVISQYIPLPAFKSIVEPSSMADAFDNYRTPAFFLVFIGVLLLQISWRKKAHAKDKLERESSMGPLERTL